MDKTSYGRAAMAKFGAVPENFHVFEAEWIGKESSSWNSMRVHGAQFNGRRRVPGTIMMTIVTRAEMDSQRAACARESSS